MTKPSAKPSGEASLKPVGRYRKVEVRTWGDEKFRALSPIPPCGAGLWLYLITGPHTGPIPGLFRAGRAGMAEELGWELEAFDKAFAEVTSQGMVKADLKARVMWIPNAIRCNRPESPNVVKSWAGEFDLIPECDLKREAYASLREALLLLDPTYVEAFDSHLKKPSPNPSAKASPKTMANQEQEQEQQAGTGGKDAAAGSPPPAPPAPPHSADAGAGAPSADSSALPMTAEQAADLTRTELWRAGKSLLQDQKMPLAQCGTFVGKLVKDHGEAIVIDVIRAAVVQRPADAASWLVKACRDRSNPQKRGTATAEQQLSDSLAKAARLQAAMNAGGATVVPASTALEMTHD